jgi:nucleoid DNA-binding protein
MATAKKPAAKKAAKKAPAKKAAKKAPAKKAMKAAAPNVAAAAMKPIAKPLTKQGLFAHVAQAAQVEMKAVKAVIANLEATILASLSKKGAKTFVWPGFFKATLVTSPARPARKGINPFTKQEQMFAAKPASAKIRIRALKKANEAVK